MAAGFMPAKSKYCVDFGAKMKLLPNEAFTRDADRFWTILSYTGYPD